MKKTIVALLLSLAVIGSVGTVYGNQPQNPNVPADTTAETTCSVNISFNSNGGQGSMANLAVTSNTPATLAKSTFTRSGFVFGGWNTQADGSGDSYADQADATRLAVQTNNGQTVVLYAQWNINPPKIKKIKKLSPSIVKVTYSKNSKANGYEIQFSDKKNFDNAKSVTVKKKGKSKEVTGLTPGKKNYVRIRSYYNNAGTTCYGDWSAPKNVKMKKGCTIENTKALTAIEADVTLTGSGSGYHAKLVLCTPTSAVSFGIQHDEHAVAPYTGKSMALIENVAHNGAGGQKYTRPGNKELQRGKTYKMMITVDKHGKGNVYLDYEKIGSFSNAGLANQAVYIRVEGAVRLNGDSVNATFDNIKLRQAGKYENGKSYAGWFPKSNASIKTRKVDAVNKVIVSGKGSGIKGDWDSDYENVSGIFQFY